MLRGLVLFALPLPRAAAQDTPTTDEQNATYDDDLAGEESVAGPPEMA